MTHPLPIWIRIPQPVKDGEGKIVAPARCVYTGLSAGKMIDLAVPSRRNKFRPAVKSVSVPEGEALAAKENPNAVSQRKKQGRRMVRLINLGSLLEFLDTEAERQRAEREDMLGRGLTPGAETGEDAA